MKASEIRYQEANCLRELAGLDRERAVALVRADDRRGWGISSTFTRYARILLRFPEESHLEAELARLGLLPAGPSLRVVPGHAPVLPEEVLEQSGRLADFNAGCSVRYCEHAPVMYRLVDLTSPELDDVVIEERCPALESIDLGSDPHSISRPSLWCGDDLLPTIFGRHHQSVAGPQNRSYATFPRLRSHGPGTHDVPWPCPMGGDGRARRIRARSKPRNMLSRWLLRYFENGYNSHK